MANFESSPQWLFKDLRLQGALHGEVARRGLGAVSCRGLTALRRDAKHRALIKARAALPYRLRQFTYKLGPPAK